MVKSKNTSKELLFNEFLKEEALTSAQEVEVALEIDKTETISYKFPAPSAATEDEIKNQWRTIRNYFRTGEKPKGAESAGLMPVLLAPYLTSEELTTDYPVFLSEENEIANCCFSDLLGRTFKKTFKEKEAAILLKYFPKIESSVRKHVSKANNFCSLKSAVDNALHELSKIKVNGEDGINFLKDIEKFKINLPTTGNLLGFSQQTPIHLLVHLLKYQFHQKRKTFLLEIHRLKSGLQDLIAVEKGNVSKDETFDFADSLIEFKKLDTLMPESASVSMPKKRTERIVNCINALDSAENLLLNNESIIYIGKALSENSNFKWKELLQSLDVRIAAANESCSSAVDSFKTHISKLAKLIGQVRIAELEVKNNYDEEIHSDYFTRFNWHYFTEEETALCPPVVLIEETQNLLRKELPHFSALISSNKPIKVLAINRPTPFKINKNGNESDELLSFQQELSALAVSHRNAFTLQSASHNPIHLLSGMESGLASSAPALFHVLISSGLNNTESQNFLDISSAVEGRQFPLFTYNAKDKRWGSRFNINANPQPDKNWPKYSFELKTDKEKNEKLELAFTFADFYAVNTVNNKNLFIVPPSCWSEDLIPLSEYLEQSSEKLYSKVPFIWLADNENTLHKAAVPYSLVIAAKERLDFWNFIQELGGVNSYHVEQAVNRTHQELQEQKEKEIKEIESKFEKQIEEVRSTAAGEAMDKLAGILLDLDSISTSPATKISKKSSSSETKEIKPGETSPAVTTIEKEVSVSTEPWIETFRCTSCNDCTDKYPRAFKYDGEKQAYVDDPTTITYAQMVKAAEACPAKCIHPGMPLNPNEPGLEELIARAKPFN
ncbi:MAG: ferredoxin [Bacteroidetes bacterium]|nr:ferredoxin [Bacteroidota bacterium]